LLQPGVTGKGKHSRRETGGKKSLGRSFYPGKQKKALRPTEVPANIAVQRKELIYNTMV